MGAIFSFSAGPPAPADQDVDFGGGGGGMDFDYSDAAPLTPQRQASSGSGNGTTPGSKYRAHLARKWNEKYDLLVQFNQSHGHVKVPPSHRTEGGVLLGKWLENQKMFARKGNLPHDRRERLQKLGVEIEAKSGSDDDGGTMMSPAKARARHRAKSISPKRADRWESYRRRLAEYREAMGDCNVPSTYGDDPSFPKWVENQRYLYHKGRLSDERTQLLRDIGFFELDASKKKKPRATSLSPKTVDRWESHRQQLVEYKRKMGNCNVPSTYREDPTLGRWVENQRMFYHKGRLSDDRVASLRKIGFKFGAPKVDRWDFHMQQLAKYHAEKGHCDVPQLYGKNPALGRWVGRQRTFQKEGKLPKKRFEKLEEVGFWD